MIYLLLSVISACMMSLVYKISAIRGYEGDNITLVNYLTALCTALYTSKAGAAAVLARLGEADWGTLFTQRSAGNTALLMLILAPLTGTIFLCNLTTLKESTKANGSALSSFFKQSGFVGGILAAVFLFSEKLTAAGWTGAVLVIIAVACLIGDFSDLEVARPALLILMFILGAGSDITSKTFSAFSDGDHNTAYLSVVYATAFILCLARLLVICKRNGTKLSIGTGELLLGITLGLSNISTNYFKLKSLAQLNASVVYPTCAGGVLILMTLAGILAFGEKTNWKHIVSVLLAAAGLVLLNI